MRRAKAISWLIPSLLLTLTSFLGSCVTPPPASAGAAPALHPRLPDPARVESVRFVDTSEMEPPIPAGLYLAYDEYRVLRSNVIEYQREIADLRALVEFYRSETE